ncbi:MAG TPA: ABC transporter ATP-binding protein [Myxococcales bacterium]
MSSPTTSEPPAAPSGPASPSPSPSPAPAGARRDAPVVVEATGVGKKYELQRHRTILLKDAAMLALGMGGGERDVFWALRDVSFQVRKGETLGLVGANGAGKSTLLSLMAKTAWPTVGEFKVKGRVSALLELGAGFHPDLTGRENIYINGAVMGLTRKQLDERMGRIIEFSELGPFIDEPVRNYSSGMLGRLGFSVAIEVDPEILIVDEVLSVGDQAFQEKSLARFQEFQQKGCTIVFVSHSLETVAKICDRAILLSHGQIIADGPAKAVADDYLERVASKQLDPKISPYEQERVPTWKRVTALLALVGLVGAVATLGVKYVLLSDIPEQRPPVQRSFKK